MASILVIEDDEGVGQVLVRMLRLAGHEVLLCQTATQALQALEALEPDGVEVVIADLFLPDKGGLDVIADLRRLHPQIPIIAITGGEARVDHDLLGPALQLGAAWALRKPFGSSALIDAVVAVLNQRPGGSTA
jgi:DNA-binding response OmpR family regulator